MRSGYRGEVQDKNGYPQDTVACSGVGGAPGTIRTSDPQIRSLMLYPAELRARVSLDRDGLFRPPAFQNITGNAAKEGFSYPLPPRLARSGTGHPRFVIPRHALA